VEYPFISDYAPIILQLEMAPMYRSYPFKLNSLWVLEADYKALVYNVWKDPKYNSEAGYQRRLVWKLKDLKRQTKDWSKQREGNLVKCLAYLESQIKDTFLNFVED
jgi:hypothetical protein